MKHALGICALSLAGTIAMVASASAAPGIYTDHQPLAFPRTTPQHAISQAMKDIDRGRDVPADGLLEHAEVQLLNRHALDLAKQGQNVTPRKIAGIPTVRDLEQARGDLFRNRPGNAEFSLNAAAGRLASVS